jgi:hypothetical protein
VRKQAFLIVFRMEGMADPEITKSGPMQDVTVGSASRGGKQKELLGVTTFGSCERKEESAKACAPTLEPAT